jgi:uncharacterized DUF497 family protein
MSAVKFDWDKDNIAHIARHDVTSLEVEQVFGNDPVRVGTEIDPASGETRHHEIGATEAARVLYVIWTPRAKRIRTVTAWKAGRKLRALYQRLKDPTR